MLDIQIIYTEIYVLFIKIKFPFINNEDLNFTKILKEKNIKFINNIKNL